MKIQTLFFFLMISVEMIGFVSLSKADWWEIDTIEASGINSDTSIDLSSNGTPFIMYDMVNRKICLVSRDSGSWNSEIITFDGNNLGTGRTVVLDQNDLPRLVYSRDDETWLASYDGLAWIHELIQTGPNTGRYCSLWIDSENNCHVAHGSSLQYSWNDGSVWYNEAVDVGSWSFCNSLMLDSGDNPHISFSRDSYTQGAVYVYRDTSGWHTINVEEGVDVTSTAIAINSNDQPCVSYIVMHENQGTILKFAEWSGSEWTIETIDTDVHWGTSIGFSFDSTDHAHVCYIDSNGENLVYAFRTETGWDIEIVDSERYLGSPSLTLDSADYPHIAYVCQNDPESLKYARKHPGAPWTATPTFTPISTPTPFPDTDWSEPYHLGDGDAEVYIVQLQNDHVVCAWEQDTNIHYRYFNGEYWEQESVISDIIGTAILKSNLNGSMGLVIGSGEDLTYSQWDGTEFGTPQTVLHPIVQGAHVQMANNGDLHIVGSIGADEYCTYFMPAEPCGELYCTHSYDPWHWVWNPLSGITSSLQMEGGFWGTHDFGAEYDPDYDRYCYWDTCTGVMYHPGHIMGVFDNLDTRFWFSEGQVYWCYALCEYYPDHIFECEMCNFNSPEDYRHETIDAFLYSHDIHGSDADNYIRLIKSGTSIYTEAPGSGCDRVFSGATSSAMAYSLEGIYLLTMHRGLEVEAWYADVDRSQWFRIDNVTFTHICNALDTCPDGNNSFWAAYRDGNAVKVSRYEGNELPEPTPITPTPIPPIPGVDIYLNRTLYQPGDNFILRAFCTGLNYPVNAHLYVFLDVYGQYWFWPSWRPTQDYETVHLDAYQMKPFFILDFIWPDSAGSADNLVVWGAMIDPCSYALIGQYDGEIFSYHL